MSRRLIDTNLIVRHLTQDHPKHAALASRLFAACDKGELTLIVLPAVLAESIFVLESFYRHPRRDISLALTTLISSEGIEVDDREMQIDALHRYATSKLHFVDCVLAASAATLDVAIATFDAGIRKLKDVRVDVDFE